MTSLEKKTFNRKKNVKVSLSGRQIRTIYVQKRQIFTNPPNCRIFFSLFLITDVKLLFDILVASMMQTHMLIGLSKVIFILFNSAPTLVTERKGSDFDKVSDLRKTYDILYEEKVAR